MTSVFEIWSALFESLKCTLFVVVCVPAILNLLKDMCPIGNFGVVYNIIMVECWTIIGLMHMYVLEPHGAALQVIQTNRFNWMGCL